MGTGARTRPSGYGPATNAGLSIQYSSEGSWYGMSIAPSVIITPVLSASTWKRSRTSLSCASVAASAQTPQWHCSLIMLS